MHAKYGLYLFVPLLAASVVACSQPTNSTNSDTVTSTTTPPATTAPVMQEQTTASMALHPGWQLASNCFQCHGTDGSGGFDRLKGMSTSEFVKEMKEFQTKLDPEDAIMKVHALAYTDAEIGLMADYFAKAR